MWWDIFRSKRVPVQAVVKRERPVKVDVHEFDYSIFDVHEKLPRFLFEYGELQKDFKMDLLRDPLLEGYTQQKFSLWKHNSVEGNMPIAVNCAFDNGHLVIPKRRVKGELYKVEPDTLRILDNYREDGVYFKRKIVQVTLPQTNNIGEHYVTRAWMYMGPETMWKERIDWDFNFYRGRNGEFSPVKDYVDYKNGFGNYYHFTKGELEEVKERKCFVYLKTNNVIEASPQ